MLMIGVTASDRGHRLRITHTRRRGGGGGGSWYLELTDALYEV